MRYWLGALFFAAALGLAYAAAFRAQRASAPPREAPSSASRLSMTDFGHVMRPLILLALAYAGIKAAFAYAVLDAGRVLSFFDLAGFLVLLAAYGFWIVRKTSEPRARTPAEVAASPRMDDTSARPELRDAA